MPGPFFWFFAVVALVAFAAAVAFAVRPTERLLGVVRALCSATIFSALASFLLGVANGLVGMKMVRERDPEFAFKLPVMIGAFVESLGPLILGCAVVATAWLLVAVGLRRQA